MKLVSNLSLIVMLSFCLGSYCCKTSPSPTPTNTTPTGGSGGNFTIVAFPEHHGKAIYSHNTFLDTAYVKYNTQEFPGSKPSLYDTIYLGEIGEEHVHCVGLKKGNYYIYMVGYDSTISQKVSGGIPISYTLFPSTVTELDLHVPVTE